MAHPNPGSVYFLMINIDGFVRPVIIVNFVLVQYNRRYVYKEIKQIRQGSFTHHVTLVIAKFSPVWEK